jgi:hypothetical protein
MASTSLAQAVNAAANPAQTAEPKGAVGMLSSPVMLQQVKESLPAGLDAAAFVRHGITLVTLAELPGSVRDELECDVEDLLIDAYGTGATASLVDRIMETIERAESSLVDRIMETIERAESADQSDDSGALTTKPGTRTLRVDAGLKQIQES